MNLDGLVNDFAIRSFRDIGDYDYISARMSFRAGLYPQYLWSALQTIEKYLKCILLINRIKAAHVKHNLELALNELEKHACFPIRLSNLGREFIKHLNVYGRFRYLEGSFFIVERDLASLDKTVWEIRRYCTILNHEIGLPDGSKQNMLPTNIERIERSENEPPQTFQLIDGMLEQILAKKRIQHDPV